MSVYGVSGLLWALLAIVAHADEPLTTTPLPDGTKAAQAQIAGFKVPAGIKVELYAAEPQLYSPVAIGLDERGRVFVAEEFRFNRGTEENRTRPFFLEDDLQIKTTGDRLAMYRKFADKFEGGMDWFRKYTDQVRLLEDKDGDGRADKSTIFAGGLNDTLDGLAAGVMARDGDVYLTNIPHLWRLRDEDGDGVAEKREKLLTGFGVNAGFLGHDLHGLVWGPDGRLYFSVGDRGFHVKTKEGTTLALPRRGAVFRCEPDGSGLEVVHIGLRNPQELAFDELGNLFADDNNCDKGDHARLVLIVPGGDSGWNMAYQTIPAPYETGPWHAEKMWHLDEPAADDVRPAFCLPPLGKLGAGPSGFAYCGAAGWPEKMRGRFYMCNYTGNGGIESFAVKPKGAAYELVDTQDVFKPIQATDCEFGYDGKMYVSDFVGLEWNGGSRGGRIYTLSEPALLKTEVVKEVKKLFHEGFRQRENDELASLLKHPDMRVRQRAQFALAERGEKAIGVFVTATEQRDHLLSRLHGIWGLGQVARKSPTAAKSLLGLLADEEPEVRANAAKTLGDLRLAATGEPLFKLLKDEHPRVRFWGAMALGQIKHESAADSLFALLKENANQDKYLRHSCVFALSQICTPKTLLARSSDESPAVRLGIVLALRLQNKPDVARFLTDADLTVATEAARAVSDLHIDEQMPMLAALADSLAMSDGSVPEPLARRILNANFRLGSEANVVALAKAAANLKLPLPIRHEAISSLADWSDPPQRDRVTGFWRPLAKRDPALIRKWLEPHVPALLAGTSGEHQTAVTKVIEKYGIKADEEMFVGWVKDEKRDIESRAAALELLAARKHPQAKSFLIAGIGLINHPKFRASCIRIFAAKFPDDAFPVLRDVISPPSPTKKKPVASDPPIPHHPLSQSPLPIQQAVRELGNLGTQEANSVIANLLRGSIPLKIGEPLPQKVYLNMYLEADVLEVAEQMATKHESIRAALDDYYKEYPKDSYAFYIRVAIRGGDAERGKAIFTGHRQAQCVRCHKVGTSGGEAAPDLSHVASRDLNKLGITNGEPGTEEGMLRAYLLESLLNPSAKIAPGYGTVTFLLTDGTTLAGIVKSEKDGLLEIVTPDNKPLQLKAADIEQRSEPKSAMPAVDKVLTLRELRDVVEYLSSLK